MFDIAIVGGMGPAATAELFRRIVLYTFSEKDQDHIKICIFNNPTIPDRTDFILNNGESPLPAIMNEIYNAITIHCEYFAIPCNTSHYFYEVYESVPGIKFINMIKETCKYANSIYPNRKICVLATYGTIQGDIYRNNAFNSNDIVYPSEGINKLIMSIIRLIKGGNTDFVTLAKDVMKAISKEFSFDDTVFILACTELSFLLPYMTGEFIDAMDVLAGVIIAKCGKIINKNSFRLPINYFLDNYNKRLK